MDMLKIVSQTPSAITIKASNGIGALIVYDGNNLFSVRIVNKNNELVGDTIWGLNKSQVKETLQLLCKGGDMVEQEAEAMGN